ncbi:MAG: hypothetical protein N3G21_11585 [Candidatus Hydrogenedentes bacterium]|nr:hypothetical protein [Candidatus Hydrogenedentota bacterium]
MFTPCAYDFFGEIPENIPTFRIKFQRDQSEVFGAIRIQGEWLKDTSPVYLKTKAIEIVIDTPWEHPQPLRRELGQKVDIYYEVPVLRKKRLEEGWKKTGFTIIDTPQGKRVINSNDYKNAINVLKKSHEIYSITAEPPLYYSPESKNISFDNQGRNFLRVWWLHIVVTIVGISLLSLVIWLFFIKGEK